MSQEIAFLLGCLMPCAVVAYTDARYHLVYDRITFPVILAGLVYAVLTGNVVSAVLGALVAGGVFFASCYAGGAGGGDFKLAVGLGLWFGYPAVVWVVLLGCFLGVLWGLWKLYRLGRLRSWARTFATGVYLRLVCGVKGTLPLEKLPEDDNALPPPTAVPFGTCLAIAAWILSLAGSDGTFAVVALAAGVPVVPAGWLWDRSQGKKSKPVKAAVSKRSAQET